MPFTPFGAAVISPSVPLPADYAWPSWSCDPGTGDSTFAMIGGTLYFVELFIRAQVLLSNLIMQVTTAGVTLTAGQNFAGLYDASGNQQAATADQSAAWQTTGAKVMPFTVPYNAPAGRYWAAFLANGTTPPILRSTAASVGLANAGLAAGSLRYAVAGTLLTALPASVVPGSLVSTGAASFGAMVS